MYLLDTNVVSEPLKPVPDAGVLERLRSYQGLMGIAAVVWHELLFGMERLPDGPRKERIRAYLFDVVAPSFPVMDYDASAAAMHATLRARAETVGTPISFADGLIAATARAHNMILVTRNSADFAPIEGLLWENWWR